MQWMDFVKTYYYGECECCCSHKVVNVCSTKLHEKMAQLIDIFESFAKVTYLCGL
jgi:hypothetical protein